MRRIWSRNYSNQVVC